MAIMITGGTGFLGSYLVRHLVQEKGITDVVLFDHYPNESRIAAVRDRVTVEQGNVLEPYELLRVMERYNIDRVVHTMGEMTVHLRTLLPEARITVSTDVPRSLYLMNNDRLVNELGFQARWTMETGMVDYLISIACAKTPACPQWQYRGV